MLLRQRSDVVAPRKQGQMKIRHIADRKRHGHGIGMGITSAIVQGAVPSNGTFSASVTERFADQPRWAAPILERGATTGAIRKHSNADARIVSLNAVIILPKSGQAFTHQHGIQAFDQVRKRRIMVR